MKHGSCAMKLRYDRPAWIEHCRARHQANAEFRRTDDGMSSGIIPFGAPNFWAYCAAHTLQQALSKPLVARVASDTFGSGLIALVVNCPYCHQAHPYYIDEEMLEGVLAEPLEAACGRGSYRVSLRPA